MAASAADAQHLACELVSRFFIERRALSSIAEITDPEMTANEFYHSIPCFIQILEKHGYIGTTLKLAKHALTALYLFLDIHALGYHPRIMWIWFDEIRKTMGKLMASLETYT